VEDYKSRISKEIKEFLKANDFLYTEITMDGSFTFDILARGSSENLIIKIIYNVDTLKPDHSNELQRLASIMGFVVMIIGSKSGSGDLEDGIMYFRHKVPIVTLDTFKEYIFGNKPNVYSGPGGYYVHINGRKMQELRIRNGCSIGYVSGKVGISRRSVSLYETGSSTTLDVYYKIRNLLGEEISQTIDLNSMVHEWETENSQTVVYNDFFKNVNEILSSLGMMTEFFKRLPFDAIGEEQKEIKYVMGISEEVEFQAQKIGFIRELCNILEREPVLISSRNTTKESIGGCSIIGFKELSEIDNIESFRRRIEKIKERI
jgi:putative transcriptional regulator